MTAWHCAKAVLPPSRQQSLKLVAIPIQPGATPLLRVVYSHRTCEPARLCGQRLGEHDCELWHGDEGPGVNLRHPASIIDGLDGALYMRDTFPFTHLQARHHRSDSVWCHQGEPGSNKLRPTHSKMWMISWSTWSTESRTRWCGWSLVGVPLGQLTLGGRGMSKQSRCSTLSGPSVLGNRVLFCCRNCCCNGSSKCVWLRRGSFT